LKCFRGHQLAARADLRLEGRGGGERERKDMALDWGGTLLGKKTHS
jgi:hypothetical protein